MGRICERQKKDRIKTLSGKRRNRRLAMLRARRCKHNMKQLVCKHDYCKDLTNQPNLDRMPVRHIVSDNNPLPGCSKETPLPGCSKETSLPGCSKETGGLSNVVFEQRVTTDHDYCIKNYEKGHESLAEAECTGRRLFDIQHLFEQIFNGKKHKPFDCDLTDMEVVNETKRGMESTFLLKCKMCLITQTLTTENRSDTTKIDINSAMTLATISTGIGFSQIEEVAAAINMPMMSNKTYSSYHEHVADIIRQTAWENMEEAGKEEARLARLFGDIDKDGIPWITVITDGAWAKRAYNINYNSASGVGCIIGQRTGKLIFLGIRNKYCIVCARSQSKNISPPVHTCFKNWDGTSTAMESDIILEGFKLSQTLHGLKYLKMVGDGDSSVQRKLVLTKPYGNTLVEKVECKNHLLRNFSNKLREISNRKRSNSKNLPVPPMLRKEVLNQSLRLRTAIVKATQYRIEEDNTHEDKMQLLINDILNGPSHVFGEHRKCSEIGYFKCERKTNETNFVPFMDECGIYQDILACTHRLTSNVNSLILNMDNNQAEHYNSVVCKFVGGKRINFSLRGAYQTRCEAAALAFNAGEEYYRTIHKGFTQCSPKKYTKQYIKKLQKRRCAAKRVLFTTKMRAPTKKRPVALPDYDYGPDANAPPLSEEEYREKKEEFLRGLEKTHDEINNIEINTRGQSGNPKWIQERSIRLTASNFGTICKMRQTTSCINIVKTLLYGNFKGTKATKYGIDHEKFALDTFETHYDTKIQQCGLFIDSNHPFLAASPDGLVGEHGIIEVKCPALLAKLSPKDGIQQKKINFAELQGDKIILKKNHNYYFQIQGQLAITKRSTCYFCIWSPLGFSVEEIQRDEEFWNNMLPKLQTFYYKCLLPELVDPQHPRGLPIRDEKRDN